MKYKEYINLFKYNRLETKTVTIGSVNIGSKHKICIQSMTNTDTLNTEETVNQSKQIIEAGGQLVRITAQGTREAENLYNIKKELRNQGFKLPLAADIHFNPKAAFIAAKHVEKVRINPGNFVDKRANFSDLNLNLEEYIQEIKKIENKLITLLSICKKHNTALRIGVNHGSLSDRIMNKYGDTPEGMVESAMEFLRICIREKFSNIIVSLKSSNTRIMVQANRLMLVKMRKEGMNFPLHLGVTEAGEGEDGRIKSAVGIGTLLSDGIGDTIRVSLTEAPEKEIPVARKLINYISSKSNHEKIKPVNSESLDFFEYTKRETSKILNIGENNLPIVISRSTSSRINSDFVYVEDKQKISEQFKNIVSEEVWNIQSDKDISNSIYPLFLSLNSFLNQEKSPILNFLIINNDSLNEESILKIKDLKNLVLVLEGSNKNLFADFRAAFLKLKNLECKNPVIIKANYNENILEDLQLKSSCDLGGLFLDGLGDGIWIENTGNIEEDKIASTCFGILQASRVRMSKTEYISCPSCGRTLFDLQKTTKKIREKTSHLKNLKIGIMGCIVNGPGEMADADYGYVGAGPGRITLYKKKEVVKKNIPEEKAVEELIKLIKKYNDWIEIPS
ncbi:MAG: (E)-4-hydroxy-3-methylbut-2-enyl-diphosphate synthase [Bacteroidales bacterium]|nr:(E)-4-hydroxy-3-methylbut-2-enyl-diphosphate synthase [Bacteroidales bacterium]